MRQEVVGFLRRSFWSRSDEEGTGGFSALESSGSTRNQMWKTSRSLNRSPQDPKKVLTKSVVIPEFQKGRIP